MSSTYSNGPAFGPITMADILATQRLVEALPRPVTDITVAPDVLSALRVGALFAGIPSAFHVEVHVDARLPAGVWHKGKPLP